MSKLNRREFKELLAEWRRNFINERGRFEYLVKEKAIKPCTIITLDFDQAESLKDFLSNSNEIEVLQDVSTINLLFGKIISNSIDTKNKLISFFNQSGNQEISDQIVSSNNNEPIIIARALGNNLSAGGANDRSIFYWLIHDLEHLIYGENSVLGKYNVGWSSWDGAYDDYTIEINNVKAGYPEDNELDDDQMEGFLNHLALHKFFKEISFTEEVGETDFPASVFSYCATRMENENDNQEIINTQSLNDEEKQRLINIFSSSYKSVNDQISVLIEKLENKILVCLKF
jgi:hypothetical protein